MQALLENTVISANHVIRAINKSNRVYTPNLQRQIAKFNHGKVKFMYNRLYDGCHPCASVVDEWVKILKHAMAVNDLWRTQLPEGMIRTPIQECYIGFPAEDSDTDSDIEASHKRRW